METPSTNQPQSPEVPPSVSLSAQDAGILLKADLENLQKKVKSGKTLSASERNLLQSALAGDQPSSVEFANTQDQLGQLIGVTRKTIQRWRKLEGCPEPRADGRWHVPSWRQFKIQRQGDDPDGDDSTDANVSQSQARTRQILIQNERLEMRILKEKDELIPKVISNQVFSKLLIAAKTRCFSSVTRFVTLARMAEDPNRAAAEIRKEMILIWQELEKGEWLK